MHGFIAGWCGKGSKIVIEALSHDIHEFSEVWINKLAAIVEHHRWYIVISCIRLGCIGCYSSIFSGSCSRCGICLSDIKILKV